MQPYLGLLGAAGASVVLFAACGGKVVVESSGATGSGGAGGSGDSSTASVFDGPFSAVGVTSVVAVGVTSAGQVGSSGITTGSGMSCISCTEAASAPIIDQLDLCPEAAPLYNALVTCACSGACGTECSANACIGQMATDECTKCVSNPGAGCGVQLKNCLANN